MPCPSILQIPADGGTVANIANLHFKSHFWHGSNPLDFHGLEDRLRQEKLAPIFVHGDLSGTFGQALKEVFCYPEETLGEQEDNLAQVCFLSTLPEAGSYDRGMEENTMQSQAFERFMAYSQSGRKTEAAVVIGNLPETKANHDDPKAWP
ncbi:hypothetical protein KUV26_20390 [Leisingera daeponensis]|uniref:Uncharacterized protein n=1 Tax=Leisingera daeponensis TaxID=405746 RepID=A0ABS7NKS8_9RHOB|nr:hypothetical protein [Leisingera daeponensis]MBY6141803.1 hypothetical protein [Leisingera daeponensis]